MTEISSLNISNEAKKALTKLEAQKGNGDGKIQTNESNLIGEFLSGVKENTQGITTADKNILKTLMDKFKNAIISNENDLESDVVADKSDVTAEGKEKAEREEITEALNTSFSTAEELAKNKFLPAEIKELLSGGVLDRLQELLRTLNGTKYQEEYNEKSEQVNNKASTGQATQTEKTEKAETEKAEYVNSKEATPVADLLSSLKDLETDLYNIIYTDGHAIKEFGVENAEKLLEELRTLIDDIENSEAYKEECDKSYQENSSQEQEQQINHEKENENIPKGGKRVTNPETGKIEIVMPNGNRYDLSGRRIR